MASNAGQYIKNFSNTVITWKISNISLAVCSKNTVVSSPEFTVSGSIVTWWKMYLHIQLEEHTIIMHLEMLRPYIKCHPKTLKDSKLKVNWMANILDSNGEQPLVSERSYSFDIYDRIQVGTFEFLLPELGPDDLVIRCYMLVDFEMEPNLPTSAPDGLRALSNALVELPTNSCFPDVVVIAGNYAFDLHRDMLSHRGNGLARLIQAQTSNEIVILNYDGISVGALFKYLYSGDLKYILSAPRITICDYIERLGIPELQNAYPKERIEIKSVVEGKEFAFKWRVEDFETIEDPLSGPELYEDGMESRWQLHLYPRGPINGTAHQKKYVFLEASLLESTKILDVYIEITSVNDQIQHSRRAQGRMKVGDKRQLKFFYRGGTIMKKCLINKALMLCFTIRIATGKIIPEIKQICPRQLFNYDNTRSLTYFSRMMGSILLMPQKYDVTLCNDKDKIRCHKFLLAARSPVLKSQLRGLGNSETLSIPNMKLHYLRVFLEYLYTGLLTDLSIETSYHLYDLSTMLEVSDLKSICSDNIDMDSANVLDILSYAEDEKLVNLKTEALQLIVFLGGDIREHPGWRALRVQKSELCNDVLDFVRESL